MSAAWDAAKTHVNTEKKEITILEITLQYPMQAEELLRCQYTTTVRNPFTFPTVEFGRLYPTISVFFQNQQADIHASF